MQRKMKGISAERQLVHQFWKAGWACIRVAGSGATPYPSPDLLAGKGHRKLAIEVKASGPARMYIAKGEIAALEEFSRVFGAEVWLAVRFDRVGWYFLRPEDLEPKEANLLVSVVLAQSKGLLFEELIG